MKFEDFASVKSLLFENKTIRQTIFKNAFWLTVAVGISRVLALILLIYVARNLGATEYGKFTFAMAFISLLGVFSDLGLSSIATREFARDKKREKEFPAVLSLKLILLVGTIFLTIVGSFFITSDPLTRRIIWVLIVYSSINAFSEILFAFLRARQRMEYESFVKIFQAFLITAFGFFVILSFPSVQNLSYGYLLASLAFITFFLLFFHFKVYPLALSWNTAIWQKFLSMSWPLALVTIFSIVYNYVDSTMMGYFGQITQTGWYNAALKIAQASLAPAALVSQSFYPVLSVAFKKSEKELQKIWNYYLTVLTVIAFPMVVGGIVLAPKIIDFIYGAEFAPSALAFQILIVMTGIVFLYYPFNQVLVVSNQQKKVFWAISCGMVVNFILNLILIPKYSLYGAAVATVITNLLIFLLLFHFALRFTSIKLPTFNFFFTFLGILFSSGVMGLVISRPVIYNSSILISILIGVVVYFIIFLTSIKLIRIGLSANYHKINYKSQILKHELQKRGILYAFKKIIIFLLRPFSGLIQRSEFLVNLVYGVMPSCWQKLSFYRKTSKILKLPQSKLVKEVRRFWYGNIPGHFDLDGDKISRKDIFVYGGPNPKFACPICQKSEWLSRVRQKNLFQPHNCSQAKECEELCKKQGNELWTHYHQNFDFMIGCNPDLPAPKCLFILPKSSYKRFLVSRCDQGFLVGKRRFATAFQADIVCEPPLNVNWSDYDFLFMSNEGNNPKFPRPDIPIILYGHDFYFENKGYQWVIDWVKPDIFLTSYPTQWKENYRFSAKTEIMFYPLFPSLFFTRPNLNKKKLDILVIGAIASSVYKPRLALSKQIIRLRDRYRVEFSHHVGMLGNIWRGPVSYTESGTQTRINYLNKWSEYLGSAKYVIFGRIADPKKQFLVWKYYEALGSGAIPIFPEVPDLKHLGIRPFEHYIPLSEIEKNNGKLKYYLDNYEKFKYIAENAVRWYKKKESKLLIEGFEEVIRKVTNYKHPKRLI